MKKMQFLDLKKCAKIKKKRIRRKEKKKTAVRYRSTGNGHGSLGTPANIESAGRSRGRAAGWLAPATTQKKKKKPAVRRSLIRFCECSPSSTAVSFLLLLEAQHLVSLTKIAFLSIAYQLFSFLIKRICQYPLHPTQFHLESY